jgi:hypothetical protein
VILKQEQVKKIGGIELSRDRGYHRGLDDAEDWLSGWSTHGDAEMRVLDCRLVTPWLHDSVPCNHVCISGLLLRRRLLASRVLGKPKKTIVL